MKSDRATSAIALFTTIFLGIGLYAAMAALAAPVGGSRPTHATDPGIVWPSWSASRAYKVGDLVTHYGTTYKCVQAHSSSDGGEPLTTPALWMALS
ncbi:carbohydrate-binding protein [Streptosporangium sp. NPDC051023]|uniref:carbohydrate-binding protein n=1 Tax=Streptosporangium sp. NPDC051023 TaxID=3155410 RepID=UPI00344E0002